MTAPPPDPDLLPAGTTVGGYTVQDCIGFGGMSQVYRGTGSDGRTVAIKVLASDVTSRASTVARFLQEARAVARIVHPNVVSLLDVGETGDGRPFIATEFLEGESLTTTLLAEGPFDWARTRAMLLQILAALDAAHRHRVIHRDMKPGNCFRTTVDGDPDHLKVLDFGVAKVFAADGSSMGLTQKGTVLGTPDYMSPEQCRGAPIDPRTDLYAVGIIAFEMLAGRLPFSAPAAVQVMQMHVFEPPPSLCELAPEVPELVEALIGQSMAKEPEDRFESAAAFAAAVRSIDPTPTPEDSGLLSGLGGVVGKS